MTGSYYTLFSLKNVFLFGKPRLTLLEYEVLCSFLKEDKGLRQYLAGYKDFFFILLLIQLQWICYSKKDGYLPRREHRELGDKKITG